MYKGSKILITGGASGIGKLMAKDLLKKGACVIIWDISQANINNTLDELHSLGDIYAMQVDISSISNVNEAAEKLMNQLGIIDIIINNAGIVVGKDFVHTTGCDIDRTMGINTMGAMYATRAFLPLMIARHHGHICNIASSAGFVADPNMSVYAASKWAMVGWSDSLRLELRKSGIKVTTVLPYYINTGMFDGVKSKIKILEPQKVATTIIKAIEKERKIFSINRWIYPCTRIAQGILPVNIYDFIFEKIFGIYSTMDNFVGRKEKNNLVQQNFQNQNERTNERSHRTSENIHIPAY